MEPITPYQMAINNVSRAIRSQSPAVRESDKEQALNSFTASEVLALAFCKSKEEVMGDLLRAFLRL